jgi:ankyrin repeat protein
VTLNQQIVCLQFQNADVLVLYSRKDSAWKIGDFGLTSEASSTRITKESRGTPGYRAPEIVNPDATAGFSIKSDIFSLGCILYELANCKPAFVSDGAVHAYRLERKDKVVELDDIFDADSKYIITKHIVAMLQIEPSVRPRASTLVEQFTGYCEGLPSQVGIDNPSRLQISSLVQETVRFDVEEVTEVLASEGFKGVERLYSRRKELLHGSDAELLYDNFQGWWVKTSQPLVLEAASNGDVRLLRDLMDADVDITAVTNAERQTTLHLASIAGHAEVVKMVLNATGRVHLKARIEAKDNRTWNPFHEAAFRGHTEIVGLLLDAEASPIAKRRSKTSIRWGTPIIDTRTPSGATALFLAASEGHAETVKRLLSAKANVAHLDYWEDSMLLKASEKGYEGVVKLLLNAGADLRDQDEAGRSALHLAAMGSHTETVKVLLHGKADVTMEDDSGNTALELADGENRVEVVELLENHLKAQAIGRFRLPVGGESSLSMLRRLLKGGSKSRKV